jgi:EAL domain-containing protein (putative c-di-GMP-specific phosphodiesterase class I)
MTASSTGAVRSQELLGSAVAADLGRAVDNGHLSVRYQPIVALSAGTVGLEALVRWERPGHGSVPRADFLSVAERTGQIIEIGAWVLEQACRTARTLDDEGDAVPVSVNLSPVQLLEDGLFQRVQTALARTGCPPERLVLEVTEMALLSELDGALAVLRSLKRLGIGLALDDFGTGFGSLMYLKRLPFDTLKIDTAFVAGLGTDPVDSAIVGATVALAHNLGIAALAEGVETRLQLDLLAGMDCDYAQGYLFSRPLPAEAIRGWLGHAATAGTRPAHVQPEPTADINMILRMHRTGASLHTIAASLNTAGCRTERGTRWTAPSVARAFPRRPPSS